MKPKKTNFTLRYDKHRYIYIDGLKKATGKAGVGYKTKEITDRNKILDSAYLKEILGDNIGRIMFENMLYDLHIKPQKSPSASSVASDESFDEIIRKLAGKKLIFEDDEPAPIKKVKRINKVKEYKDKKFTESEQRKIDKYLNTPLSKSDQLKIDKYLEKDKKEKVNNFYTPLTKEQERKADEYLNSHLTKEEKEMIAKYL